MPSVQNQCNTTETMPKPGLGGTNRDEMPKDRCEIGVSTGRSEAVGRSWGTRQNGARGRDLRKPRKTGEVERGSGTPGNADFSRRFGGVNPPGNSGVEASPGDRFRGI